jgi:hypothetical protein
VATAKANHPPALALAVIRPALVEAKLLTDKHARDAVYVVTLAAELRSIEGKIVAMRKPYSSFRSRKMLWPWEAPAARPKMVPMRTGFGQNPLPLQTSYELFIRALCSPISNRMSTERRPEAYVNPGNIRSAVRQVIPSLL